MNASRIKLGLIIGIGISLAVWCFSSSPGLSAAESPMTLSTGGLQKPRSSQAFLTNAPADRVSANSSAVDANGVRYRGIDYERKRLPWLLDVTKAVAPDYPDRDRILRHQGTGLFQIKLDLKTGLVTKATVIKSTGFPALDTAAVASLRQWRWKAGKWKEIEIAVRFTVGFEDPPLPRSARIPYTGRQ
jgi:TonB family protein